MSNITTTPVEAGDVAAAATANANYAAIAAGTAAIDSTNTQTEWCSAFHVDTTAKDAVFNTDMATFCNSTLSYTLTSESYVTINLGGTTPVRLSWSPNLVWDRAWEMLRVHADINVDAIGELTLPSILGNDQDCFFLELYYKDNANNWIPIGCEWGHSVTNYTEFDVTNITFPTQPAHNYSTKLQDYCSNHTRHRMRCSVTGFLSAVANGIKAVELRAKLKDNTVLASVTFKEATMVAYMMRN